MYRLNLMNWFQSVDSKHYFMVRIKSYEVLVGDHEKGSLDGVIGNHTRYRSIRSVQRLCEQSTIVT